jgi:hypothetical protein
MRLASLSCIGVFSFFGLALGSRQAAAEDYAIQVVVQNVAAMSQLDRNSAADFFTEINIAGSGYRSPVIFNRDRIVPGWSHFAVVSREELVAGGPLAIDVGVRDAGDRFGLGSNRIDVSGNYGDPDLHLALQFDPRHGLLLYDVPSGRIVQQLRILRQGARWTSGPLASAGLALNGNAQVTLQVNVVRVPPLGF